MQYIDLVYIYIRIDVTKCIFAYVYKILFTHQQNNRKKQLKRTQHWEESILYAYI